MKNIKKWQKKLYYSKTQAFKNYLENRNNNINYVNNKFGDYDAFIYPKIKDEVVKLTNIDKNLRSFDSFAL